jgi:hypothetical protein
MMLNAFWAFVIMSVWAGDSGFFGIDPVGLLLGVFAASMMLLKKIGVVRLIFLCAGIAVGVKVAI